MRVIAIGLFHLLVVHIRDLELCLGGFRQLWEEGDEILVFDLRLLIGGGRALGIPRITYCQLGSRNEFGIGIGIDERLQRDTRHVVLPFFHCIHSAIEQHFVRLLGIYVGDWIVDLVVVTACHH